MTTPIGTEPSFSYIDLTRLPHTPRRSEEPVEEEKLAIPVPPNSIFSPSTRDQSPLLSASMFLTSIPLPRTVSEGTPNETATLINALARNRFDPQAASDAISLLNSLELATLEKNLQLLLDYTATSDSSGFEEM